MASPVRPDPAPASFLAASCSSMGYTSVHTAALLSAAMEDADIDQTIAAVGSSLKTLKACGQVG